MVVQKFLMTAACAGLLVGGAAAAHASTLGINFASGAGTDVAVVSPTANAGVVPQLNFNNETGATGSATGLLLSDGSASGASLTYSAADTYSNAGATPANNNGELMHSFLDDGQSPNNPTTVSLTGLGAGSHNLYLYIAGDQGATDIRGGTYDINGTTVTLGNNGATDANAGTFDLATPGTYNSTANTFSGTPGNYYETTFSGDTLSLSTVGTFSTGSPYIRSPVDGLQVTNVSTAIPEPATLGVFGLGAGLLLLGRKRRKLA